MKITIQDLPTGGYKVSIHGEDVGVIFKAATLERVLELIPTYVDVRKFMPCSK